MLSISDLPTGQASDDGYGAGTISYSSRIKSLITRLLFRESWTIGIMPISIAAILDGNPVPEPCWLEQPRRGRFYADPFLLEVAGQLHVLFEMWSPWQGRGWIAAALVSDGHLDSADKAIDVGCHMSYPSIVTINNDRFCVPESWEAGGARLYRMGRTVQDWTPVSHILPGLPLVDPTIFEHDGLWWLFATKRGAGPDMNLHAWYSETPFEGWKPHPLNPIKSDVASSRPAGNVFRTESGLYRPAQDCSAGYGSAIVINHVVRLDPDGFHEVCARRLAPGSDWAFPHGLHTINICGSHVVIDGKRMIFDPLTPFWKLIPHIRRRFQRLR